MKGGKIMLWTIQNLIAVFLTLIIPLLILCIIQYGICKYCYKLRFIIPFLCFIFLIIKEIQYFESIYALENYYFIVYGIFLVIPYGSLLFGTVYILLKFKKRS